jgi:AcrR family transcriptional regulator
LKSSLRQLAKAAGTSDRMLLYYFRDKEELLAETTRAIAARMTIMLTARMAPQPLEEEALIAHLVSVMEDEFYWPYMRLWLEMASRAAGGDGFFKQIGRDIGTGFLLLVSAQLAGGDDTRRATQAARVMRATEGWLFLKAIGLDEANDRALNREAGISTG